MNVIRAAIRKLIPGANVNVDSIGDGIILTGFVQTPIEAQQAADLAARLAGGARGWLNALAAVTGTTRPVHHAVI